MISESRWTLVAMRSRCSRTWSARFNLSCCTSVEAVHLRLAYLLSSFVSSSIRREIVNEFYQQTQHKLLTTNIMACSKLLSHLYWKNRGDLLWIKENTFNFNSDCRFGSNGDRVLITSCIAANYNNHLTWVSDVKICRHLIRMIMIQFSLRQTRSCSSRIVITTFSRRVVLVNCETCRGSPRSLRPSHVAPPQTEDCVGASVNCCLFLPTLHHFSSMIHSVPIKRIQHTYTA